MIPHLVYFQLVILVLLLWLCIILPHLWPSPPGGAPKTPTQPIQPKRKRSPEPKAFAGLTQKPPCAWCEQQTKETALAPPATAQSHATNAPPPPDGGYVQALLSSSWVVTIAAGWPWAICGPMVILTAAPGGNSSAPRCDGYFPEHHGTLFHGKQAAGGTHRPRAGVLGGGIDVAILFRTHGDTSNCYP